jgi:hypothetical protein
MIAGEESCASHRIHTVEHIALIAPGRGAERHGSLRLQHIELRQLGGSSQEDGVGQSRPLPD